MGNGSFIEPLDFFKYLLLTGWVIRIHPHLMLDLTNLGSRTHTLIEQADHLLIDLIDLVAQGL